MPAFIDLSGQLFGRLTVMKPAGRSKCGHVLWLCRCSCGRESTVMSNNLRKGNSQSCSCLRTELLKKTKRLHGHYADEKSPTVISHMAMIARCTNPTINGYSRYGGANPPVKVCPEWMKFTGFLASMGPRPEGTSIGRILDMGDYEPGNAFFQTPAEQKLAARNKRALLKWAASQSQPALQAA